MNARKLKLASAAAAIVLAQGIAFTPQMAHADQCSFTWRCPGCASMGMKSADTERYSSRSACQSARSAALARASSLGGGFSASSCSCQGSSTSPYGSTYNPPSGPTPAQLQQLEMARRQEQQRLAAERQREERARQQAFEASKSRTLGSLMGASDGVTAAAPESAALRQLGCSVSRAQAAVELFDQGDYVKAVRLSRAAVGEAQAPVNGGCRIAGLDIPMPTMPVDESESPEAEFFRKVEQEITRTVEILSKARQKKERAQNKTEQAKKRIERQENLAARLIKAPPSAERDAGIKKADDLLAKAKALLAASQEAEAEADAELAAVADDEQRLRELEGLLADALAGDKTMADSKSNSSPE